MAWVVVHSTTHLPVVVLIKARVSEDVKVLMTNHLQIFPQVGFVSHNLDPEKVIVFISMKVWNICLQSKSNSKKSVTLQTFLGLAPKFHIVACATKRRRSACNFKGRRGNLTNQ